LGSGILYYNNIFHWPGHVIKKSAGEEKGLGYEQTQENPGN